MWGKEGVFYQIVSVFTGAPIYFRSQHRPPPRTFFGSGEIDSRDGGPHWFLASCLGPRLLLVSAPVVAMPDDDQLSDLASVQILSHPHLAQSPMATARDRKSVV